MARSPDVPRQTNVFDMIGGLRAPVTETDDGWIKVGDPNDEISPPWQNGWDHADPDAPVSFFVDKNGIVRIRGEAVDGTPGTVAFTLPEGYRPEFAMRFIGSGLTGDAVARIKVAANGDVTINSSGTSAEVDGGTPATRQSMIQFRRGTAAAWTSANPVLANGEPGFESDTNKLKIGDGTTAWTSLAYI